MAWRDDTDDVNGDGMWYYRAIQNHSNGMSEKLNMDGILERIDPDHPNWSDAAFHGTVERNVANIVSSGLTTRFSVAQDGSRRTHIHMVPAMDRNVNREQEGVRMGSTHVIEGCP